MNLTHLHLVLTHVPVLATYTGLALLIVSLFRRSNELKAVSLSVLLASGLAAVAVYLTGGAAEEAIEHLPGVSEAAIERHERAAVVALAALSVMGAAALLGLAALWRVPRLARWPVAAALTVALLASGVVGWTANLGGRIRHTELGQPAPAAPHQDAED